MKVRMKMKTKMKAKMKMKTGEMKAVALIVCPPIPAGSTPGPRGFSEV